MGYKPAIPDLERDPMPISISTRRHHHGASPQGGKTFRVQALDGRKGNPDGIRLGLVLDGKVHRLARGGVVDDRAHAPGGKAVNTGHLEECPALHLVVQYVQMGVLLGDALQSPQKVSVGRCERTLLALEECVDRCSYAQVPVHAESHGRLHQGYGDERVCRGRVLSRCDIESCTLPAQRSL